MLERYSTKETRSLWSDEKKYELMAQVELTVLAVQEQKGIVPAGTFDAIKKMHPNGIDIDVAKIQEFEQVTKHETAALVAYLESVCGDQGRWIHYGLTSSDILDTAQAIVMRDITNIMIDRTERVIKALNHYSFKYAKTLMIGRSHGIHAEPTTFGYILAGHCMEMRRGLNRLRNAKHIISYGKISGPVGNYTHVSPEVEQHALEALDLKVEPISTQVIPRDRYAEYFADLALVATSIERLVTTIRHLQRTEINELAEGFAEKQKGSSAMPHKKNPILSENLTGLARVIRSTLLPAFENVVLWHERDMSHSSVERFICPDATTTMVAMLDRLIDILSNLTVNEDKMKENLNMSYGVYASQAILLALISGGLTRAEAYEIVQFNSFECVKNKKMFAQQVLTDPRAVAILSVEQILDCCDPSHIADNNQRIIEKILQERY